MQGPQADKPLKCAVSFAESSAAARTRRDRLLLTGWFLLTRLVLLVAFALAARHTARTLPGVLSVFDGTYYHDIAAHGYPTSLPSGANGVGRSTVAFFPLFPALAAALEAVGLPFTVAASAVTLVSGLAATLLVHAVVGRYANPPVALAVAGLWSVQPLGFVLSLTYSEALYSALTAGCILLLMQRRWLLAGVVAAAGSATRPTGLVLAVCLLVAVVADRRRLRGAQWWHAAGGLFLAPLGFLGYMAYLRAHTGRLDAWFVTERQGWGVYTDGGGEVARRFITYLTHPGERPAATAVALLLVLTIAAALLLLHDGAPAPLIALTLLTLALAVSTRNAYSSIPRFLLPASFPLLVPIAIRLVQPTARFRRSRLLVRGAALEAAVATSTALVYAVMVAAGLYATMRSQFPF